MRLFRRFLSIICLLCLIIVHVSGFSDAKPVFLVFGGKTGWIGQQLVALLEKQNHIVVAAESRLEDRKQLEEEIRAVKPNFIINAAGVTGRPNVDWCEDHKVETLRANIIGALNLADVAYSHQIHVTNFGTGCIYQYDEAHPMYSGMGFKEEEKPNFSGSFYSKSKIMLDELLKSYPNVLNLRLRMPISSDLHPRSFVTKIIHYEKVINIPNSMTVLDDLLPVAIEMALRHLTGNYNFTNPGAMSHNDILSLYQLYVDPSFTWKNFTVEEQNKILKAQRSNNELDVSKLLAEFPNIPSIQESMENVFKRMKVWKDSNP